MPPVTDQVASYANDIVSGKIVAGWMVRAACQRHLDDLKHGHERGLTWDSAAAQRAIEFFPDVLRLAEGEHAGKPFVLQPWQAFCVGSLFGWKGLDGFRRFRVAYLEIGKGNGKSPMAGGIGLYMMLADGEVGAHCFAAATTREQANILFQDAVKMVDASPELSARVLKSGKRHVFNLAHMPTGSFFRSVSSEGKGLDGKRVHFAALDEIHEHPSAVVVEKMRAGTKGRRQALIFEITNSGFDRNSVCYQHHEYASKILSGVLQDDTWFCYVCTLDPCEDCRKAGAEQPKDGCKKCDDWRDERVWLKTNPNLDISITRKYIREQNAEAAGMPAKENIVKRLNHCIWTEGATRWMPMDSWDACGDAIDEDALIGRRCFGGVDLASKHDLAALVWLFPPTDADPKWRVLARFWVPEMCIAVRAKKDRVPYDLWVEQEHITATPGPVIDYDFIEERIREDAKKFQPERIGFDPHNAPQIISHLKEELGNAADKTPRVVDVPQNSARLNTPTRDLLKIVVAEELAHGGNPVLRWNASNVVIKSKANQDMMPDKDRSTERYDGISGLLNAYSLAIVAPDGSSIYESEGLMTL